MLHLIYIIGIAVVQVRVWSALSITFTQSSWSYTVALRKIGIFGTRTRRNRHKNVVAAWHSIGIRHTSIHLRCHRFDCYHEYRENDSRKFLKRLCCQSQPLSRVRRRLCTVANRSDHSHAILIQMFQMPFLANTLRIWCSCFARIGTG